MADQADIVVPPTEDIGFYRNAVLETMVRRMPDGSPVPDSSVNIILESAFSIIACIAANPGDPKAAVLAWLELDRQHPIRPKQDPAAYLPLVVDQREDISEPPDHRPNPERFPDLPEGATLEDLEMKEIVWPCYVDEENAG